MTTINSTPKPPKFQVPSTDNSPKPGGNNPGVSASRRVRFRAFTRKEPQFNPHWPRLYFTDIDDWGHVRSFPTRVGCQLLQCSYEQFYRIAEKLGIDPVYKEETGYYRVLTYFWRPSDIRKIGDWIGHTWEGGK